MAVPGQEPAETFPRRYDRFELLEKIGEGGMAEVFKARHLSAGGVEKILVIKRILPHLAGNDRFVKMFKNEARLAAKLDNNNIVKVHELGKTDGGEYYISMEYVPGIDLRGILRNAARRLIRIPVWFTVHTLAHVSGGLAYAHEFTDHEGKQTVFIHRDVTPSNVFISKNGEVKLADFGIAKAVGQFSETRSGQLKGKISYMPPEQLHGETLDPRADVFSAGVVLWECLTQRRLFGGRPDFETMLAICEGEREPPSRYNPAIPPDLDDVTLAALSPDRDERTSSAREFQAQLLEVLSQLRSTLLPTDIRHVVDVLTGDKEPHPEYGADLPREGSDITGSTIPRRSRQRSKQPITKAENSRNHSSTPGLDAQTIPNKGQEPPPKPSRRRAVSSVSHAPLIDDINFSEPPNKKENSIVGHYTGPYPFYVLSHETRINGPLAYDEMLHASDPRKSEVQAISHDGNTWTQIKDFALLTGLDFLAPANTSLSNIIMVTRLEEESLISILSRIARAQLSGRLVIMETGSGPTVSRREIDISRGAPSFVYTDQIDLQTPSLLVRRDIISDSMVPEIIHNALKQREHLDSIISRKAAFDLARHRSALMRDRLNEIFKWKKGKIAFSESAQPRHQQVFAASLLHILFDGVHRAWTQAELTKQLGPDVERKWTGGEKFESVASHMDLNETQWTAAKRLCEGKSASQITKKHPADAMVTLVMTYMLTEMGLLVERRS